MYLFLRAKIKLSIKGRIAKLEKAMMAEKDARSKTWNDEQKMWTNVRSLKEKNWEKEFQERPKQKRDDRKRMSQEFNHMCKVMTHQLEDRVTGPGASKGRDKVKGPGANEGKGKGKGGRSGK